jgi:hypothetical protein
MTETIPLSKGTPSDVLITTACNPEILHEAKRIG